ncbi:HAD family hydrolase [Olsenella porci]|jgi:phosphoglycolate phosphatase|uniref:HAD-IA family hydrolase n=1 Tax=Olsenella porci TaxID=2652279 RepID=A0A6N7XSW1_9ACTN|nr:HAD-IA family hydrolase [Olsenella porci]MST72451.1 HAD-IA family hydrolase [Olsenella porci]
MAYRAAIFDLDGTLLNTLDDLAAADNYALAQMGMPARSREEVRAFLGNGTRALMHLSVPEGTDAATEERAFEVFTHRYNAHHADSTAPYPGIVGLVRDLRNAGMPRAVVSNKPDGDVQALIASYFPGLFDAVVGQRDDVRRKPAPDSLLAVMRELSLSPRDVVYVGDSEVDVQTAANAGTDCVIVSWGFRDVPFLREHGAEVIVSTPDELRTAILGAGGQR